MRATLDIVKGSDRFTYDDDTHVYTLNGSPIPSNTRILEAGGITNYDDVPKDRLEYAKNRGKAVHKAAELHLNGMLDRYTLHQDVAPYLEGFVRFEKLSGFKSLMTETPIYSKVWRFGTTPDLIGFFHGAARWCIVEMKTTAESVAPGRIQTAGQLMAAAEFYAGVKFTNPDVPPFETADRYVLELKPGDFKLHGPFVNTQEEIVVFQSCVWTHNWKLRFRRQNGGSQ